MKQTQAERATEKARLYFRRYGDQGEAKFGSIRTTATNMVLQTRFAAAAFVDLERKLLAAGWKPSPSGLASPDGKQEVSR